MTPILHQVGDTDHAKRSLPIASRQTVVAHTRVLLRDHRRPLLVVLALHGLAALGRALSSLAVTANAWRIGRGLEGDTP